MPCDMCGTAKVEAVCSIEGSELTVCGSCAKYGQLIRRVSMFAQPPNRKALPKSAKIEEIVANFAEIIRSKRESLKLTQEDFAKKIQEKENAVHKWETGHLKPDLSTAKKLERILGMKLIVNSKDEEVKIERKAGAGLTIGDILKVS